MRGLAATIVLTSFCTVVYAQSKRGYLRNEGKGANRNIVYIDYNRHSKYYSLVNNFKLNGVQLKSYKDGIKLIKGKSQLPFPKYQLAGLPLKWCRMYSYQAEAFIYYPANPDNNYRIAFTDTTSIEFNGSHIKPMQLLSAKEIKTNTYNITRMGSDRKINTIVIHIVDPKNGVALFENLFPGVKYSLMVEAEKVGNFEIIVNYSKNGKATEYPFAPPDLRNLIEKL